MSTKVYNPNDILPDARRAGRPRQYTLSSRQREVIELVAKGKINQEIADELHISRGVVERHINDIFKKLGVNNRANAIVAAIEQGYIKINYEDMLLPVVRPILRDAYEVIKAYRDYKPRPINLNTTLDKLAELIMDTPIEVRRRRSIRNER